MGSDNQSTLDELILEKAWAFIRLWRRPPHFHLSESPQQSFITELFGLRPQWCKVIDKLTAIRQAVNDWTWYAACTL